MKSLWPALLCAGPIAFSFGCAEEDTTWDSNGGAVDEGAVETSADSNALRAAQQFPTCPNGSRDDTDGDGWGWSNNRTCKVVYPNCPNGSKDDTDGDGWGWYNNQSCKVVGGSSGGGTQGTVQYPNCPNGSKDDSDGDGWGWYNNASCKVVGGSSGDPGGTGQRAGGYEVTGRTSMGLRDPNQCGIDYSGNERVGNQQLLITGIDNTHFGTNQDGQLTSSCGRVAYLHLNGKRHPFVIVDRIWEARHASQLDVAREFFYGPMGSNNVSNGTVEITSTVASGLTCRSWTKGKPHANEYCSSYLNY